MVSLCSQEPVFIPASNKNGFTVFSGTCIHVGHGNDNSSVATVQLSLYDMRCYIYMDSKVDERVSLI